MASEKKNSAGGERVISDYIKSKKPEVCRLVDTILKELSSPDRISSAPINQLSSVMGTMLDKFGSDEKSEKDADGILATLFDDFDDVK